MRFILALLIALVFSNQSFAGTTFSKVVSAAMDEIQSDTADEIEALLRTHADLQREIRENFGNETLTTKQCQVASRLAELFQRQGNLEKKRKYDDLAEQMHYLNSARAGDETAMRTYLQKYPPPIGDHRYYREFAQNLALKGRAEDQAKLANIYYEREPVDLEGARKYYQLSSDQGYFQATVRLAYMTMLGLGGAKDTHLAMIYYRRVIKEITGNHPLLMVNAAHLLGTHFEKGEGVEKNLVKAMEYYIMAREICYRSFTLPWILQDTRRLALALAQQYEHGQGVEKSLSQAIFYYKVAGRPEDVDRVTRMTYSLRGSRKSPPPQQKQGRLQ